MRPFCSTVVRENKSNTPYLLPLLARLSSSSAPVVPSHSISFSLTFVHTVCDPALLSFRRTYICIYTTDVTHKRVTKDGAVFFTHTRNTGARAPTHTHQSEPRRRTIIERRRLKLFHAHTIERDPRIRRLRTHANATFDFFLSSLTSFFSKLLYLSVFLQLLSSYCTFSFYYDNSRPPPCVVPLRLTVPLLAGAIGAQRHCASSAAHRPSFALRDQTLSRRTKCLRFDRVAPYIEREIYGNIKRFIYRKCSLHLLPCYAAIASCFLQCDVRFMSPIYFFPHFIPVQLQWFCKRCDH